MEESSKGTSAVHSASDNHIVPAAAGAGLSAIAAHA